MVGGVKSTSPCEWVVVSSLVVLAADAIASHMSPSPPSPSGLLPIGQRWRGDGGREGRGGEG
eukprot:6920269-Pyramimonas_sp.AAC.1